MTNENSILTDYYSELLVKDSALADKVTSQLLDYIFEIEDYIKSYYFSLLARYYITYLYLNSKLEDKNSYLSSITYLRVHKKERVKIKIIRQNYLEIDTDTGNIDPDKPNYGIIIPAELNKYFDIHKVTRFIKTNPFREEFNELCENIAKTVQ